MLLESVGGNAEASRLAGIRSRGLILLAYVFCGLCAGIAGVLIASNVNSADGNNAGLWIELDAILAVVIGGTALTGGRYFLAGTMVGALVIQTLTTTIYSIGIPPETTLLFKALVVTVVCLLQSPAFRAKVFKRRRQARRHRRRRPRRAADGGAGMSTASLTRAARFKVPPKYVPVIASFALFVLMFVIGAMRYPAFGSAQVILNIFVDNSFLLVVAVGMTFVILTGGIDLSVGAVVALGTVLCGTLIQKQGWSPYLVIPLVLLVGALLGLAMGCDDPLLRDPAVHRHARRAVPRARPVLRDHDRLGDDRRPDVRRRWRRARCALGDMFLTTGAIIALVVVADRLLRPALHAARAATSTRSAAASSRRC